MTNTPKRSNLPETQDHSAGSQSPPITATQGACVSCRSKKLKCDRLPNSCNNCARSSEQCVAVDPGSGRTYARSYVDNLRDRADALKRDLRVVQQRSGPRQPSAQSWRPQLASSAVATVPIVSPNYRGLGSIFSIGQLVAAAVSSASDTSVLRLRPSSSSDHQNVEKVRTADVSLPTLAEAVELVKSYLEALHVTMPFMRQKDIYNQLERLYTDNPPYSAAEKVQDLFQLHMIFAIGAMRSPGRWKNDYAQDHYVTAIRKEESMHQVSPFAWVQNLLLIWVFTTLHNVGIASPWEITRQAMRVCVRYGFHSSRCSEENILREQLRRKIFWSVYIADRHSSHHSGRPVAIQEADITIDLPINQDDEKLEAGLLDPSPYYTEVTVLIRHGLLRQLGTKARLALGPLQQNTSVECQIETTRIWNNALEAWYKSSIVKPCPTNAYETKEYLDINFHRERMNYLSYLVLPFGTEKNDSNTHNFIEYLWQYTLSAYEMLLAYQKQAEDRFLIPNWTYVQDVLKCGFGILYCALKIQSSRRQRDENVGLFPLELDTVVKALKLCGETLGHITTQWQTVKRHADAFMQMSESVLELIASIVSRTTEQSGQNAGGHELDQEGEDDLTRWDIAAFESTKDMFQTDCAPFTDAEWAELFDLIHPTLSHVDST